MSENAIVVEGVSKAYQLGTARTGSFRDWVKKRRTGLFQGNKNLPFYALKDVSFSIPKGSTVGIIGANGSGKSTLLKIISRITLPTKGSITVNGRVSSLLELGTGFHPDLTGRENVLLNGALLGMSRQQVKDKFDEIVDFSELSAFIDTPVKHYSSGMYLRLAFSVAAHLESDIMILDEVLAVGDMAFQQKCIRRIKEISQLGRTVLLVSHNMDNLKSICDQGIYLKDGKSSTLNKMKTILREYSKLMTEFDSIRIGEKTDRYGTGKVIFEDFWTEKIKTKTLSSLQSQGKILLVFKLKVIEPVSGVDIGFSFHTQTGKKLDVIYSSHHKKLFSFGGNNKFEIVKCLVEHKHVNHNPLIVKGRILIKEEVSDYPKSHLGKVHLNTSSSNKIDLGKDHSILTFIKWI